MDAINKLLGLREIRLLPTGGHYIRQAWEANHNEINIERRLRLVKALRTLKIFLFFLSMASVLLLPTTSFFKAEKPESTTLALALHLAFMLGSFTAFGLTEWLRGKLSGPLNDYYNFLCGIKNALSVHWENISQPDPGKLRGLAWEYLTKHAMDVLLEQRRDLTLETAVDVNRNFYKMAESMFCQAGLFGEDQRKAVFAAAADRVKALKAKEA